MKRHRFNSRVGRSAGLGTYRNTGRDYPSFYRTLYERGRPDLIVATVDYSTTICGESSYKTEQPVQIDDIQIVNIWDIEYWMHEDVVTFKNKEKKLQRVFDSIINSKGMTFFEKVYTPVYWDNGIREACQKDLMGFADLLVHDRCKWNTSELYNFALRRLDDRRRVLYARNKWLQIFKSGRDIMNYYAMARKINFNKVYKF